jgi:nucleoside-diphosphate-sugar epimerase
MTIVVTGASGALGRVLVEKLRAISRDKVVGFYRRVPLTDDDRLVDLAKPDDLRLHLSDLRPGLIFNLVGNFSGHFDTDFAANVVCAKNIFDALISEKVGARVVLVGSAAEYGMVERTSNPISETYPCRPVSTYGLTKKFQTDLALFYARAHKLDVVVGRLFNLAGAGLSQRLFYGRAISEIREYKKNKIKKLNFGNLDAVRDYIKVEDAVDQLFAIARFGESGGVYNLASGVPVLMRDLLSEMLIENKIPLSAVVEGWHACADPRFEIPVIYADVSKVRSLVRNNGSISPCL